MVILGAGVDASRRRLGDFMEHDLFVRDATVGERPEVAEVTRLAYAEFAQSSDPAVWASYQASTRRVLLEDNQSRRVVVTLDGQIVASVLHCPPREGTVTTVLMQTAKSMYERRGYVRSVELDFEPAPGFVVWGYTKQLSWSTTVTL